MIAYPVRSILFVPANRIELTEKAIASSADAICIDLEDGVAISAKEHARGHIRQMIASIKGTGRTAWIRVNSELEHMLDDLAAVPQNVDGVVLPKARGLTHVNLLSELMDRLAFDARTSVIAMAEDAASIANFGASPSTTAGNRLSALALGVEDLAVSLFAEPGSGVINSLFHRLLLASVRLGIPCIGYPGSIANYKDLDAIATVATEAARCGAVGGFCIHPGQVDKLNDAFGISEEACRKCQQIVSAYESHMNGVLPVVDGLMVDRPVYLQAKLRLTRGGSLGRRANQHGVLDTP